MNIYNINKNKVENIDDDTNNVNHTHYTNHINK